MSGNSTMFSKRLAALASRLAAGSAGWATREEWLSALDAELAAFWGILRDPRAASFRLRPGRLACTGPLVALSNDMVADVDDAYARLEDSRTETLARIVRAAATMQALQKQIARASDVAGSIYRTVEDRCYEIGCSFADTLFKADGDMTVHRASGALTLPVASTETVPVAAATVSPLGNGSVVSGHEATFLLDGDAKTWFAYERPAADGPLKLVLDLRLDKVRVVDAVQVDPYVGDGKAYPTVEDILVSLDGNSYESVLADLYAPLDGTSRRALTTLGPIGLRNATLGEFIFRPRTARHLRLVLKQVHASAGGAVPMRRIAVADVRVQTQTFASTGTMTTRPLALPFAPRYFRIDATGSAPSALADVSWQLSADSGATWVDLARSAWIDLALAAPAAFLASPKSVIVRALAKRNDAAFVGAPRELVRSSTVKTERFSVASGKGTTTLSSVPVQGSLEILVPALPVGAVSPATVGRGAGAALTVELPRGIAPLSETIRVAGIAWRRVPALADCGPDDRAYVIDYASSTATFGDGRLGAAPSGPITLETEPERLVLPANSPYEARLARRHDFDPKNVAVVWNDRPRRIAGEALAGSAGYFQLAMKPVLEARDAVEDVPPASVSFWLRGIPADAASVSFSDGKVFAARVDADPAQPGEYRLTFLASPAAYNPVLVETYSPTDAAAPGTASYASRATIRQLAAVYDPVVWWDKVSRLGVAAVLDVHEPVFGDPGLFLRKRPFVDGVQEIEAAGDWSLDAAAGRIHYFKRGGATSFGTVDYTYRLSRDLDWSFGSDSSTIVVDDATPFVNANDDDPAVLDGTFYDAADPTDMHPTVERAYAVRSDGGWTVVPARAEGVFRPFDPATRSYGDELSWTASDLLRGWTLPEGATRVRLPHACVMRGSLRFVHLSDDQADRGDRRVVTDPATGLLATAPKWIKDAAGNVVGTPDAEAQTQREADRLVFSRERTFVDGATELELPGDWSVDYAAGTLHAFSPTPAHTIVQYKYADVRASYLAHDALTLGSDWSVSAASLRSVSVSDRGERRFASYAVAKYEAANELQDDPSTIRGCFSPIVLGYKLTAREA